jgi:hypothetical protein
MKRSKLSSSVRGERRQSLHDMQKLLRASTVMIALAGAGATAHAGSLQVAGTAGYLSEWEFDGAVSQGASTGGNEYSGSMIWKHVGLCSVSGPETKKGEIKIRLSKSGSTSEIDAAISFNGAQCVYRGEYSGGSYGHMDCPDAKGVPLSISIK